MLVESIADDDRPSWVSDSLAIAAEGLAVEVPPASSILVDLGSCAAPLAPAASCTIVIGGSAAETATLVIAGEHTTTAEVVVTLVDDVVFEDGFDFMPSA